MRMIIFILAFSMPIDWFEPTGATLRELGAKPANIVIVFLSLLVVADYIANTRKSLRVDKDNLILLAIFVLGTLAFTINLALNWSPSYYTRSALFQFLSQGLLLLVFIGSIPMIAAVFSIRTYQEKFAKYLIVSTYIYLVVYYMELAGVVNHQSWPLTLFRTSFGDIARPTALSSEPSYFGVYAAMLIPIILIVSDRKIEKIFLISLLAIAAIITNGKTFYLIILITILFYFIYKIELKRKFIYTIPVLIFSLFIFYQIFALGTFNFDRNLSSVMRIGSSHLALNVIASEYGLTGIGFGQFHFFFLPEHAPTYLLRSAEAVNQFSQFWDSRASTFNLFLRIGVEAGLLSFALVCIFIHLAFKKLVAVGDKFGNVGFVLLSSSVGFLLTQDTYLYPPLLLSIAISQRNITGKYGK